MDIIEYLENLQSLKPYNLTFEDNGSSVKILNARQEEVCIIVEYRVLFEIRQHNSAPNLVPLNKIEQTLLKILPSPSTGANLQDKNIWPTLSRLSNVIEQLAARRA